MFAPLLVVDKEVNPIEAINKSNTMTYGKKWTIFLGLLVIYLVSFIALAIIFGVLGWLFKFLGAFGSFLMLVVMVAGIALVASIIMSTLSYMYGELSK